MSFQALPQSERVAVAREKYTYFMEDFGEFQDFSAKIFTQSYADRFLELIDTARDLPTDETVQDELSGIRAKLEETMVKCRKQYKRVKFFVKEAFENDLSTQNRFGLDDYAVVRRDPEKMVIFMSNLNRQLNTFHADLEAVGLNDEEAQMAKDLRDELESLVLDRKTSKGDRSDMTQTREAVFKELANMVSKVCEVGRLVYEDENMARYKRYLLPRRKVGAAANPSVAIDAGTKQEVFSEDLEMDAFVDLSNEGEVSLYFYMAESTENAVPNSAVKLEAGETHTFSGAELGGDAVKKTLIAWNEHETKGKYKIEMLEE